MLIKKGYTRVSIFLTLSILIIMFISSFSTAIYVTTKLPLENSISDFHNNKIVFSKRISDDNFDVFLYDISTQQTYQITTDSAYQSAPKMYNDKIIWIDERNSNDINPTNYDIYLYNTTSNKELQITKDLNIQWKYDIYQDIIIWEDNRNREDEIDDTFDIYMYDLTKDEEIPICTNQYDQRNIKIYKDKIIWMDNRNSFGGLPYEFFIFNLSSNQEKLIEINMRLNLSAAYYSYNYELIDNNIFWINSEFNENGDTINNQIFLYDLRL